MGDNEETIATQEPEHRISVNDVVNAAAKGDIETLQAAASSGIGVHDRASVPPGMSPL